MKYCYSLENLNCAHCASEIEQKISSTEGYGNVSLNFATKKLNFESETQNPLAEIQQICDSIEDGVKVTESSKSVEEKESPKFGAEKILLIIAVVLGLTALALGIAVESKNLQIPEFVIFALSLAAAVLSGWKVLIRGIKNIFSSS